MNLLIDTHAFIWFVENNENLPTAVKNFIEDENNTSFISIVSLWEITIKISIGKLKLNSSLEQMIENIYTNGFNLTAIQPKHLLSLSTLDFHHNDPFDRMIIAQGIAENYPIVSSDDKFDKYPISRIWR